MRTQTGIEGEITRGGITVAAALPRRESGADVRAEAVGFNHVSRLLAIDPSMALFSIPEIARTLCNAGTAGVSLLRSNVDEESVVRWAAVNGALRAYEGVEMPRRGTPCGHCLDTGAPILVAHPALMFPGLPVVQPTMREYLVVPLSDSAGDAIGTLWLAQHDRASRFSADDVRIAEQLAHQLVLGMKLDEQARNRDQAVHLFRSHQMAQQKSVASALHTERARRRRAEAALKKSRRMLAVSEAMVLETNHRTKNALQTAESLLAIQARAAVSAEVRDSLLEGRARLHSLSLVHASLCQSTHGSQTVHIPRLLESLCQSIREAHGACQAHVTLTLACAPISLGASDAVWIATLINEAITNAYKHAFPHDRVGEIAVSLSNEPEQALVVRVTDTGVGADVSAAQSGLGIDLMRTIAKHLHGDLKVSSREQGHGIQVLLTIDRLVIRPA